MVRFAFAIITLLVVGETEALAEIIPITASGFAHDAQVITFEDAVSTDLPPVEGVTFLDTLPSSNQWYGGGTTWFPLFGDWSWGNWSSVTYGDLGIDFVSPVQAVGGFVAKTQHEIHWGPFGGGPYEVEVELFDQSLVTLGTAMVSLPRVLGESVFFGFTADRPIRRFRMTGNNSGFFVVDNFTFGAANVVPEPSTLALAGLPALLGLVALRRRKRA